jgi:hypothetical protein
MHDLIYQNDISRMMGFVNKTCLDWESFRHRQEQFLSLQNRQQTENGMVDIDGDMKRENNSKNQFFRVVKSKTEVKCDD